MFCHACGKQHSDNAKFCDSCGTPSVASVAKPLSFKEYMEKRQSENTTSPTLNSMQKRKSSERQSSIKNKRHKQDETVKVYMQMFLKYGIYLLAN